MARATKKDDRSANGSGANLGFEAKLWAAADALRNNMDVAEYKNYRDVLLERRLRQALVRLNPELPREALEDAYRKLTRIDAPSLVERNRAMHRMLVDGVTVEYRRRDGSIAGAQARIIDFDVATGNDWLAVNQFTVCDGQHTRRPDVVLFVNGLPLAVIELKNSAEENATMWSAYRQLQTYQAQAPSLFATNAVLAGLRRRAGTDRLAGCGQGVVQAMAHHHRSRGCALAASGTSGGAGARVRAAALSRPAALLHRVRGFCGGRRRGRSSRS